MNNEQAKALKHLQELAFQVQESVLFLDTHPDNSAAQRYYQRAVSAYQDAMKEYASKYAPLSANYMAEGTGAERGKWTWVNGPWPWELDYPNNGDAVTQENERTANGREE